LGGVENKWMHLDPNQTNHIGTGAKCPRWIMGGCSGGYNFARCTLGPESNNLESCTLPCWSSDWFIKKNADGSVRLDKE
jgi:hypothetical protein